MSSVGLVVYAVFSILTLESMECLEAAVQKRPVKAERKSSRESKSTGHS